LKDKDRTGEHGNAQVDTGPSVEYLMCTITESGAISKERLSFPNSQKLLSDPGLWIADSAVTTHTTPHDMGMTKRRLQLKMIRLKWAVEKVLLRRK
jgi:hypothetical protein